MKQQQDRTWLCSVVRTAIVGYAQLPVAQQVAIKARLGALSHAAAANVRDDERLVVDTGDGVVLCFLGDPEDALQAALSLQERLRGESPTGSGSFRVRIGIHLGPVKMVKGRDGHLIPAGAGLSNAQYVMGSAEPGQILASHSFYEMIANLSQGYVHLFRHLGSKNNEHPGAYPVYEVMAPGSGADTTQVVDPPRIDSPNTELIAYSTGWERAELTAAAVAIEPYVGQRARVLVKAAAERATSVAHLYRLLAEVIPTERDRAEFSRAHGIT
jgi:class 3 adenylate cyclase